MSEKNQGNNLIYNSVKMDKILRNKCNQGTEKSLY